MATPEEKLIEIAQEIRLKTVFEGGVELLDKVAPTGTDKAKLFHTYFEGGYQNIKPDMETVTRISQRIIY